MVRFSENQNAIMIVIFFKKKLFCAYLHCYCQKSKKSENKGSHTKVSIESCHIATEHKDYT